MKKLKVLLGLGILALAVTAVWQIGSSEFANAELRDDLHDLASQLDTRIGFSTPKSDEDYRAAVIRKAMDHGIDLQPSQVIVERIGTEKAPIIYLATDYTVRVGLPGFSYALHFTPSSGERH